MNGLIIREPWIGKILSGTKTWELRTAPTSKRGRVGLIRQATGMVVGVAAIVDSLPAVDATGLTASRERHGISPELDGQVLADGWAFPWVLHNVRRLPAPVPAGQKPGQVIWVTLPATAEEAINAQCATMPPRSPQPSAPMPVAKPTPHLEIVPSPMSKISISAGNAGDSLIKLTEGAIRNGNLCVRSATELLPDGVIGGPSRDAPAANLLTVIFDPGESVETDIAGDKMLLRCRGAVADFFARSGARAGDHVQLSRQGSWALKVQLVR